MKVAHAVEEAGLARSFGVARNEAVSSRSTGNFPTGHLFLKLAVEAASPKSTISPSNGVLFS
jgi:hypothetical protein